MAVYTTGIFVLNINVECSRLTDATPIWEANKFYLAFSSLKRGDAPDADVCTTTIAVCVAEIATNGELFYLAITEWEPNEAVKEVPR